MAQWTVHQNPNPATRKEIPYVLDVQADLLSSLGTRVVVPLYARKAAPPKTITRLTPEVKVRGERLVVMTPQMAGIRARDLGDAIADLSPHRSELIAAMDLLFTGA